MEAKEKAELLLSHIRRKSRNEVIDFLIRLGEDNIFIPVMIQFVKLAREKGEYEYLRELEEYMNAAYSPGLRAHILDDFIRDKIAIQAELNELKARNNIYVLEQKLFMYKKAEKMLRSTATAGSTYEIMKILEFRGDIDKPESED